MEQSPLDKLLKTIKTPQPLASFISPVNAIQIRVYTTSGQKDIQLKGLAPFHTIDDIQRALWLKMEKQDELFPSYVYLSFRVGEDEYPAMFTYKDTSREDESHIEVPNPIEHIQSAAPLRTFVDENGDSTNPYVFRKGSLTLQDAFLNEYGQIPTFSAYSFLYLKSLFKGVKDPFSSLNWYGFFYPYFPHLDAATTGRLSLTELQQRNMLEEYIKAKLLQIHALERLVEDVAIPEFQTTGVKYLQFQWTNMDRSPYFDGVDALFFSQPVNAARPFMRLITPSTTPMTKLFQPISAGLPAVNDPMLLKNWVREESPISDANILFVKALVRPAEFGYNPLYSTLRVLDDTTADFSVEAPKDQRILDIQRDLRGLETALLASAEGMPFSLDTIQLGKAHLRIELQLPSAPNKNIRKLVQDRMARLTALFQEIEPEESEQAVFASYRYKGVSNFSTPNRIFAYIHYMITRKQIERDELARLIPSISKEFEISEEKAKSYVTDFLKEGMEASVKDVEGEDFLIKKNPGVDITISAQSITSFTIQLYNLRRCDVEDIRRICTAIGLVFLSTDDQWNSAFDELGITRGVAARTAVVAEQVEQAAAQVQKRVEAVRVPPGIRRAVLAGEEEDAESDSDNDGPAAEDGVVDAALLPKEHRGDDQEKLVVKHWFINRLKQLDSTLFGSSKKTGASGTSAAIESNYSRKCPPAQDRYPFVLNLTQYQNMRKIYAEKEAKGDVAFIEYGTPNTAESIKAAKKALEKITVLRYGSDPTPKNLLYFLCHSILCLRDLLPILQRDWDSELDYQGKRKDKESCPFCHGTEIKDREAPKPGETVFIRKENPKQHKWVGFLGNPEHPEKYELPCCFVVDNSLKKPILWEDPRFDRMRTAPSQPPQAIDQALQERGEEDAKKSAELQESLAVREQLDVPYDLIRWKIAKEYILGTEKYPLDSGKVGLLSQSLDAFFGQNSQSMVSRVAIKQEFLPTAHGFFRIGVNNKVSYINNSLFAAIAPMLGMNTIRAVQDYLVNRITPRIFINLNFGNLVLEFFNPKQKDVPAPILTAWAQNFLRVRNMTKTMFEINRFYNAYHNFIAYIKDDYRRKQLRHFVHVFAEPGLLTPYGITLLTLHYKGDPAIINTPVEVLCPMMGFDMDRYSNNTVGFLTYSDSKIWEPLIYLHKLNPYGTAKSEVYYTVSQGMMENPGFPTIVKNRYQDEFLYKCASAYRGAFTFQSEVDARALVPLTRALNMLQDYKPSGIVRDMYNHVVAITLQNPNGKSNYILVPVVDDGNTSYTNTGMQIHLGIPSIDLAPANDTYECYEKIVSPLLYPLSSVYKIHTFLAIDKNVVAFELGGPDAYATIVLPCTTIRPGGEVQIPAELIEDATAKRITRDGGFQFEYLINNEIIKHVNGTKEPLLDESSFILKRKQANILYEHFRLSFSKWISSEDTSELRKIIEGIIQYKPMKGAQANLGPIYSKVEKMQELRKRIGPTLESWFVMDDADIDIQNVLLKKDCIHVKKDKCSGACIFDEVEDQCKIHAPRQISIASNPVVREMPAAKYFVDRLLDELIRLPIKRQELLTNGVRRIEIPATNIHIGTQWILPENTPAWYDLLRGESQESLENPEYYEEFSRSNVSEDELEELKMGRRLYPVPDQLAALLPEKLAKELAVEVIGNPSGSRVDAIRRYFGMPQTAKRGTSNVDLTSQTLLEISGKYKVPVIQIQLQQAPIIPLGRVDESLPIAKSGAYVVIPDFDQGPAILVKQDDVSDVIPSMYLKGALLNSIEPMAFIRRKKPVLKLTEYSNSNSNSNNSPTPGLNRNSPPPPPQQLQYAENVD
jgi:hypothetical protein